MNEQQLKQFYSTVSFAGLMAIYALKLSLDNKTAFDRDKYCKEVTVSSSDYFYGFIIACSALGMVDFNYKDKIITVTEIDSDLNKTIVKEVEKASEKYESWKTYIENAKKYFE